MPKITVYEAPDTLGIRPSETATSARSMAGRAIEGEYNEIAAAQVAQGRALGSGIETAGAAAVKYLDHQQISAGSAAFASFVNAKTRQWDETVKTADPNDPTVAPKFMADVESQIQNFKGGFLTENAQQWAEAQTTRFRSHMYDKTGSDMAVMAGQAAVINTRQTVNALSNTVRGDPKSLDYSLEALESTTNAFVGSSPNLTGTTAGKVRGEILQKGREEIIKSAAMGYIEKTGEVPPWVTDPKYSGFINGTELKQFAQAARYYSRLGEAENRAARVQRDYELKNDFNTKINELETRTAPHRPGDPPVLPADYWDKIRELGRHPGAALEPGRLKTMIDNGTIITERLSRAPRLNSDPDTLQALTTNLTNPERPTTLEDVIRAEQKLSDRDFSRLRQNVVDLKKDPFAGPATQAAIHAAKDQLTYQMPGLPGKDPKGSQAYADFMNEFVARYLALPQDERPKATNFSDKSSLINEMVQKYDRTPAQKLKDRIDELSTLSPATSTGMEPPAPGGMPRPKNTAEKDALKPGTKYIWIDGSQRTRQ